MNLTEYLLERKGQKIARIRVVAAHKQCLGTVENVVWNYFPAHPEKLDIERSWVTIQWDNRKETQNSVDFMEKVEIAEADW